MSGDSPDPRVARLLAARGVSSTTELLHDRYGLHEARLDPALLRRQLADLPDGATDEEVEQQLVEGAVIGETFFLRHRGHLEWLRRDWLPTLAPGAAPLQVLFAACSTGEEVWSLLGELGGEIERVRPAGLRILATDVSERALGVARGRHYRPWSLRGVDLAQVRSWLTAAADGGALVADPNPPHELRFAAHNLLQPLGPLVPQGGFDLVICRNMLIYLDAGAQAQVWANLAAALKPGGVLLTAPADPGPPGDSPLTRSMTGSVPVHRTAPVDAPPAEAPVRPTRAPTEPGLRVPAPPPPPELPLAARLAANGRPRLAHAVLEQNLAEEPDDVDSLVLLALLASELGDHRQAVEAGRKASYLAPEAPYPAYAMAIALRRAGRVDAADRRQRAALGLIQGADDAQPVAHSAGLIVRQLRAILEAS